MPVDPSAVVTMHVAPLADHMLIMADKQQQHRFQAQRRAPIPPRRTPLLSLLCQEAPAARSPHQQGLLVEAEGY